MAQLKLHGRVRAFHAEPETPLLWVLREQLGLTGNRPQAGEFTAASRGSTDRAG
jgi:isoquinoline 1-oxidoreductase alpha subunit